MKKIVLILAFLLCFTWIVSAAGSAGLLGGAHTIVSGGITKFMGTDYHVQSIGPGDQIIIYNSVDSGSAVTDF